MPAFNKQFKPLQILALSNVLINEIYAKGGGRGGGGRSGGRSRGGFRGGSSGGYGSGGSGSSVSIPVAVIIIPVAIIILLIYYFGGFHDDWKKKQAAKKEAEKAQQETAGLTGEADYQPPGLTVPPPTTAPIGNAAYPTSTAPHTAYPAPIEPVEGTYTPMSMSAMNGSNKTGEPNGIPVAGLPVAGGSDGPMPSAPPPAYGM